ncbi:M20 family metallo-hydrolase [Celeribacter halophilus]|uniref:M20 family metallo-hydrolase n=1 Tax=Celeribacter halophilus TaxID=576117 RepID=A0AAW7XY41_9RHOB|nr:M20 family metallo-hydrolase [Celeribacter halophilus]MDO6458890.1 M20 family metallo-hydrolase [Celeribacter halophilus]
MSISINIERLMVRIFALGKIGALPNGGCKRLALSEEDKAGRTLVTGWLHELGLEVHSDVIGNTWAIRPNRYGSTEHPVVMGSHIDTVGTGGLYDGNLGVLGGIEVIESMIEVGVETERPVAVAFFTNEEGARFQPDMMGSGVAQGALDLAEMLASVGIDGISVSDALDAINAGGDEPVGALKPSSYLELHIEQGPVLETQAIDIGVVTGVQGISWSEFTITGQACHAGTTPMPMRHDSGVVAAGIALEAWAIAQEFGAPQVATVGRMRFEPDLVNVVPEEARMTVDLRNTSEDTLRKAEARLFAKAEALSDVQGCTIKRQSLARFEPVAFDSDLVESIAQSASELGYTSLKMPSGAGHDAQMFAPQCPSAMIFVPSRDGISHNIHEYTAPDQIAKGVALLAKVVVSQAGTEQTQTQRVSVTDQGDKS